MAARPDAEAPGSLRLLFGAGTLVGLDDARLLEMFLRRDGEVAQAAFAAIVRAHGPAVLRACRAATGSDADAEDAFQATFLILASRAASVRRRRSLTAWLHGVALRTASAIRRAEGRRRLRERRVAAARPEATGDAPPEGLRELLHEELARLPERHRAAILLCDLEGLAHEEAARRLGCPLGTLKSRLARGRAGLHHRLTRRGLAPAAALGGLAGMAGSARAAIPFAVPEELARVAVRWARGRGSGGPIPGSVATLVREVSTIMALQQLGKVACVGIIAGVAGLGAGWLAPFGGRGPSTARGIAAASERGVVDAAVADDAQDEVERLVGTWVRVSTNAPADPAEVRMEVSRAVDEPGEEVPPGGAALIFEWRTAGAEGAGRNRGTIDPTRDPKRLDFIPEGAGAPKVCPGIYKLEGKTLTICYRPVEGEHPTRFVAAPGSGLVLDVYRRAEP